MPMSYRQNYTCESLFLHIIYCILLVKLKKKVFNKLKIKMIVITLCNKLDRVKCIHSAISKPHAKLFTRYVFYIIYNNENI